MSDPWRNRERCSLGSGQARTSRARGGGRMTTRRGKAFVRKMARLVDATDEVCEVLERYRRSSLELARRVDRGDKLEDIYPVIEGPARPREVTEVLAKFEAARHQVRLAMFELGAEQGLSASEVGRQLGMSRQRASALVRSARASRGKNS